MSNKDNSSSLPTASATNPATLPSTYSNYIELESQFILRMPYTKQPNGAYKLHSATVALRDLLDKAANTLINTPEEQQTLVDPLKDRLFIEINAETRKGRLKFDDEVFDARLVDLPCIVESLKTIDRKAFFKTADICQMLVCKTKDDPWTLSDEELFKNRSGAKKSSNEPAGHSKKYQWPSGITAPMKNVRKKRFRKLVRKKAFDYEEIVRELKHLFIEDREAIKAEYEVVYLDKDPDDESDEDYEYSNEMIMMMGSSRARNRQIDMDYSSQDEMTNKAGADNSRHSGTNAPAAGAIKPTRRSSRIRSKEGNSNLSTGDAYDEGSSSHQQHSSTALKSHREVDETTGSEMDRPSNAAANENSNMDESTAIQASGKDQQAAKSRTNFKNLFVKDVIGDLSSSDEDEEDDDDDDMVNEDDGDYEFESKSSKKQQGNFTEKSFVCSRRSFKS
jgi:transcription initiation factor TFIID subunit 7